MPVGELQRRMSSREFAEWVAYFELEPFGERRADLRAGIVASTIANAYRDTKKRKKPFAASDFMPTFETAPKQEKSPLVLRSIAERLNAAFGGKDLRGKNDGDPG